jgi:hypothetical protein
MGAGLCVVLPNRRQTDQSCCLVLAGLNFCISSIMTEQFYSQRRGSSELIGDRIENMFLFKSFSPYFCPDN